MPRSIPPEFGRGRAPRLRSLALLAALSLAAFTAGPAPAAEGEASVRAAFERYRRAILEHDGEAAASVLTPETLAYYGRLQKHALFSSAEKVRALPVMERVQVLFYRMHVPPEDLVRMSPEQVVAYAVEAGWVGRTEMEHSTLGRIEIDAEAGEAMAEHVLNGQPTGVGYHFVRDPESKRWRFDLLPILEAANDVMKLAAERSGMDEAELVGELLRTSGEEGTTIDVWEPLFPDPEPAPKPPADAPPAKSPAAAPPAE